jgi:HEAT repeat protein
MLGARSELSTPPPPLPTAESNLEVMVKDRRHAAVALLLEASTSSDPMIRAHSIDAPTMAPKFAEEPIRRGLADDNRGVRFTAAMAVGRLKLANTAPLLQPLLLDDSRSVRAAAIYGQRRCGIEVDPTPLARMLMSEDPEVKANAALVLGELGNKSAMDLLRFAIGKGITRIPSARAKVVELQLAEAMVMLGARHEIDAIRAALFAPTEEAELSALACQMCGRLHDTGAVPDLSNIARNNTSTARPVEVRLAAVMALAEIDRTRLLPDLPLQYVSNPDWRLRAQAAYALGAIADPNTMTQLSRLMADENPIVQVAAARAMLRMPERLNAE